MSLGKLIKRLKKITPPEILDTKFNPEALAYITAGDKSLKESDYSQAIIYFTKAIECQTTNHYSFLQRGICYKMVKNYDKALTDLFKSKQLDNNFENNQAIAECYLFKKEFSQAISYFDEAIRKLEEMESIDLGKVMGINYGATKARALNNQAICYYNLQMLDQAIECSTKGIQENPNYSNNYRTRGMIYLSQGNRAEARTDLKNAVRLGDTEANIILTQI